MAVLPGEVEVGVGAAAVGQQGLGRGGRGVAAAAPPPDPAPELRQLQTAHEVRPPAAVEGPQRLPRVGDHGGDLAAARPGHAHVSRVKRSRGGKLKTPALE